MLGRCSFTILQSDGRYTIRERHVPVCSVNGLVVQLDCEGERGCRVRLPYHRLGNGEAALVRRNESQRSVHRLLLDDSTDHVLEVLAVGGGVGIGVGRVLAIFLQPGERVARLDLHIGRRRLRRRNKVEARAGSDGRDFGPVCCLGRHAIRQRERVHAVVVRAFGDFQGTRLPRTRAGIVDKGRLSCNRHVGSVRFAAQGLVGGRVFEQLDGERLLCDLDACRAECVVFDAVVAEHCPDSVLGGLVGLRLGDIIFARVKRVIHAKRRGAVRA